MTAPTSERITIALGGSAREPAQVSGLWTSPAEPAAAFVFAHGAGAGMTHPFMTRMAEALAAAGIASLRYQFPYCEQGRRRPDPPALCHATVRAAVRAAQRLTDRPLFAGGKSFGGRMTSQAQAAQPLPGVRGLIFVGFPLHPAGRPSRARADHLAAVRIPMLFLQGTRDELAELSLIEALCRELGARATLHRSADADHAFHVPARSGRSDAEVLAGLVRECCGWMRALIEQRGASGEQSAEEST